MRIGAILTIHLDIIIQTINDALFGGLLSVSTLDHVAVSPLLKSYRSHWKMCRQILKKKTLKEPAQFCRIKQLAVPASPSGCWGNNGAASD